MTRKHLGTVLDFIRAALGARDTGATADADLLDRFVGRREEAAFATLLERHGPLVLGVCRRVLGNAEDADDAFQATFLVLVRQAASIRKSGSVASWLHGVAYRVAMEARRRAARRRAYEKRAGGPDQAGPSDEAAARELRSVLDEELEQLPAKYRSPLVLHYLAGRTKEETAQQLGWSEGTVSGRLARARDLLRERLTRRGVALSASALSAALSQEAAVASVSAVLASSTVSLATLFAAGEVAGGASAARIAALTERVVQTMFLTKMKIASVVLLVAAAVGLGAGGLIYRAHAVQPPEEQQSALAPQAPSKEDPVSKEMKKLEGSWIAVAYESGGEKVEGEEFKKTGLGLIIKDGKIRMKSKEGTGPAATIKIDPTKVPKTMDRISTEGAAKGMIARTIYELDGDTLRICLGFENEHVRPRDFAFKGTYVMTYKRLATSPGAPVGEPAEVKKKGATFRAPGSHTHDVALSPDGKLLARAGTGTTELWDVASGKKLHTLKGQPHFYKVAFSPDGKTLASGSGDVAPGKFEVEVKLWDVATGKERVLGKGQPIRAVSMAFSPDSKTLATSYLDPPAVRLWDLATGKAKMELGGVWGSLAFSPDGKTLAIGDSSVHLWDLTTGKKRVSLARKGDWFDLRPLAYSDVLGFSPDGKTLVSAGLHKGKDDPKTLHAQLTLWDVATAKERATIAIPGYSVPNAPPFVFTADGKTLITAVWIFEDNKGENSNGRVSVQHWDLATGKTRATFWTPVSPGGNHPDAGHVVGFFFAALSADGKTVAWGGAEGGEEKNITGTAHVWEVRSLATSPPRLPKEIEKPPARKPAQDAQLPALSPRTGDVQFLKEAGAATDGPRLSEVKGHQPWRRAVPGCTCLFGGQT